MSYGFDMGECVVKRRTEKAMLIEYEGEDVWVPFSQVHDDSELYDNCGQGECGQLVVSQWWAKQRGYTEE